MHATSRPRRRPSRSETTRKRAHTSSTTPPRAHHRCRPAAVRPTAPQFRACPRPHPWPYRVHVHVFVRATAPPHRYVLSNGGLFVVEQDAWTPQNKIVAVTPAVEHPVLQEQARCDSPPAVRNAGVEIKPQPAGSEVKWTSEMAVGRPRRVVLLS
jgi:hypothetical protein